MNGQQMVDAVVQEGGFDVASEGLGRATVAGWLGGRYDDLVVRSQWLVGTVELGPSVVGQGDYVLPTTVSEVQQLRVGTQVASRTGTQQLWMLQGQQATVLGAGAFYAPTFNDAGQALVSIFPVPIAAGVSLQALCVLAPPAFEDSSGFTPIVPRDFHRQLVDGAMADGLRRIDERLADANDYEARFENAVARLQARKLSRVGQGVQRLQVSRRPR